MPQLFGKEIGDYVEVLALLALFPIIVGLWSGFASAAGGGGESWELLAANATFFDIDDESGTYKIVTSDNIEFIIETNGNFTSYINGESGGNYAATIVANFSVGEVGTSSTTLNKVKLYVYSDSVRAQMPYSNYEGYVIVNIASGGSFDVYKLASNSNNLVDAFFIVLIVAMAGAVVSKLAGVR